MNLAHIAELEIPEIGGEPLERRSGFEAEKPSSAFELREQIAEENAQLYDTSPTEWTK